MTNGFEKLEDLIQQKLDDFVVKDTYTKGKNAGLRKVLALIKDMKDESEKNPYEY